MSTRSYENPSQYASLDILKGIFFYSFQIYSDFYGYSIIAIGSALIMGIRIMDNFKTPYLARNIAEFWQRWHISLSTWFRDYLYYPMGGNRVSQARWILNILVVFVVSGLWHGANRTFIIWGGLFGMIYLLEKGFDRILKIWSSTRAYSPGHLILALKTFVLVSFIWVFFRSQSFEESLLVFKSLFNNIHHAPETLTIPLSTWAFLAVFIVSDIALYNKRFDTWTAKFSFPVRWALYGFLIFAIIVFAGTENFPFIYFQF